MNHKAIAKAALKRHDSLLRATRGLVDSRLPQLTPVDAGLPKSQICKTNPNSASKRGDVAIHASKSARPTVNDDVTQSSIPVDARLPQLTSVDVCLPDSGFGKTNPSSALTPRKLAAARLLAQGRSLNEVARELRLTRQGLWKWRRQPTFAAEVLRLHDLLARPVRGDPG